IVDRVAKGPPIVYRRRAGRQHAGYDQLAGKGRVVRVSLAIRRGGRLRPRRPADQRRKPRDAQQTDGKRAAIVHAWFSLRAFDLPTMAQVAPRGPAGALSAPSGCRNLSND